MSERVVTHEQARRIYELIGRGQDTRPLSERRALDELARRCAFEEATAVIEFGCGTGRFAAELLRTRLSPDCRYLGCDVSPKMVALASGRLSPWSSRAVVRLTDGSPELQEPDGSFDRFVSTYVLDLLSAGDIDRLLAEAHRVLRPGGLLGLVSLTKGASVSARVLTSAWERLWAVRPWLLGGCRPVEITASLPQTRVAAARPTERGEVPAHVAGRGGPAGLSGERRQQVQELCACATRRTIGREPRSHGQQKARRTICSSPRGLPFSFSRPKPLRSRSLAGSVPH